MDHTAGMIDQSLAGETRTVDIELRSGRSGWDTGARPRGRDRTPAADSSAKWKVSGKKERGIHALHLSGRTLKFFPNKVNSVATFIFFGRRICGLSA